MGPQEFLSASEEQHQNSKKYGTFAQAEGYFF